MSLKELFDERQKHKPRICIGDVVRHFEYETNSNDYIRQYLYTVVGIGHDAETGEPLVIYRSHVRPPHRLLVMSYEKFMSEVDTEKYPDIKQKYCFEVVAHNVFI